MAARIRTGIERGRGTAPWWRRPGGIAALGASLATVAAAVALGLVLFRPSSDVADRQTPSPSALASVSASATATPAPTESAPASTPSAAPSSQPTPTLAPVPLDQPAGYFTYVVKDQRAEVTFVRRGGTATAIKLPKYGMPVDASLSPDGSMLAFRVDGDLSGLSDFYALDLADGTLSSLGTSLQPAYGLGAELAWSPDSRYLAFTLTDPNTSQASPAIFTAATRQTQTRINGETPQSVYVGGWMPNQGTRSLLWVSTAAAAPFSDLIGVDEVTRGGTTQTAVVDAAAARVDGVFEPLPAPDGRHVIFWRGTMGTPGGHWSFSEGGMPWLANVDDAGKVDWSNARQVFSTLAGGREMFRGASIAWGPDSDAFAVWNAQWTGVPQGDRFPDSTDVYLGHVSKAELITAAQTLDAPDTKGATEIVDVALAADGNHLGLTALIAAGAEGGAFGPTAQLRLVTRGYGTDPDKVEIIGQNQTWNGPAVYPNVRSR